MNNQNPESLKSRTKRFALRIIKMFSALPKTAVERVLGRQVLRSGTSVGANYREGYRARCDSEFISKLGDSDFGYMRTTCLGLILIPFPI